MTTLQAHMAKLYQLTLWEKPEATMLLEYAWPVPVTEHITYGDWLERERRRINATPHRLAVIVEQGDLRALYVNAISQHPGEQERP